MQDERVSAVNKPLEINEIENNIRASIQSVQEEIKDVLKYVCAFLPHQLIN